MYNRDVFGTHSSRGDGLARVYVLSNFMPKKNSTIHGWIEQNKIDMNAGEKLNNILVYLDMILKQNKYI